VFKVISLWVGVQLLALTATLADEPCPPAVYALYGSGEVAVADYAYYSKKDLPEQKADLHTLYFLTIHTDGDSLWLRTYHFRQVKYFLLNLQRWLAGAEYARKRLARKKVVFLPIVLSDGISSLKVFEVPDHRRYYLQVFKPVKIGNYTKRKLTQRDYIFDPNDDYRKGGLLAVATSLDNLNEARKESFVKKALNDYKGRSFKN